MTPATILGAACVGIFATLFITTVVAVLLFPDDVEPVYEDETEGEEGR